jgi:hypothetical protein
LNVLAILAPHAVLIIVLTFRGVPVITFSLWFVIPAGRPGPLFSSAVRSDGVRYCCCTVSTRYPELGPKLFLFGIMNPIRRLLYASLVFSFSLFSTGQAYTQAGYSPLQSIYIGVSPPASTGQSSPVGYAPAAY